MPQSRGRIYIIMIRLDIASAAQVDGLLHLIQEVFPGAMSPAATVADVLKYVKMANDDMGPLHFPPVAKDGLYGTVKKAGLV